MPHRPAYCLSARFSADYSFATIDRAGGESATVSSADLGALFLDLSVGDDGEIGTAAHHHEVLHGWFTRGGRSATREAA